MTEENRGRHAPLRGIEKIASDLQIAMRHAETSNIDPTDYERIGERHKWLILEALKQARGDKICPENNMVCEMECVTLHGSPAISASSERGPLSLQTDDRCNVEQCDWTNARWKEADERAQKAEAEVAALKLAVTQMDRETHGACCQLPGQEQIRAIIDRVRKEQA